LIYAEIGREVARNDHDSVSRRAVVPGRRKLALLAASVARSVAVPATNAAPPLPEARFLVEAVAAAPPPPRRAARQTRGVDARAAWVLDLFLRLQAAEGRGAP
jgi:phytoene synthase